MAKNVTPKELATELKVDPKKLRGYLRKNHTRSSKQHNTNWEITPSVAKAARAHFKGSKPKAAPAKARAPRKAKAAPKPVEAQVQAPAASE